MTNTKHKKSSRPRTHFSSASVFAMLATAFLFIGFLRVSAQIPTTRNFLTSTQPHVLGDSEEIKPSEDQKHQIEQQQEAAKKAQEQMKELGGKPSETPRVNLQPKETEIETKDGVKVKTKIEDNGSAKIEVETRNTKLHIESKDRNSASDSASEQELELEDESETLHIATDSGNPSLTRGNVRAHSDFPLSINASTSALLITTPRGTKTVTILPDQAVENMMRTGLISTTSANVNTQAQVTLTERNGAPVYEIGGIKKFKIFGLFEVQTPTQVVVSAQSGDIISQQRSLLTNIIDLLSP